MGYGLISGLIWGGVTSGLVLAVLSLYAPLPEASTPQENPELSEAGSTDADTVLSEPEPKPTDVTSVSTEESPAVAAMRELTAPQSSQQPERLDTQSAAVPEPDTAGPTAEFDDASPDALQRVEENAIVTARIAVPQPPSSDSAVPGRVSPLLQGNRDRVDETPGADPTVGPIPSTAVISPDVSPVIGGLDASPSTPSAPSSGLYTALPNTITAPSSDTAPTADSSSAPRLAIVQDAPTPDVSGPATLQPASSDQPIALPVPKIENPTANVVVNRLPSLGAEESAETEQETEAEQVAILEASEVGALKAYAAAYEGTASEPVLSFIVIDTGVASDADAPLVELGVPFSVAIDASLAGAAERAAQYRAAGVEVLAIANDLPSSAAPSDVTVALSGYFSVLGTAIAVLDPLDARIQGNRSLLQPVLGSIRETGHGFITYDRGLNTAQQAARREGIASATVFRTLDANEESASRIKRYLKRAEFAANNDGAVVVMGHSYPETLRAVMEWALEDRPANMRIAPVSQVMLQTIE